MNFKKYIKAVGTGVKGNRDLSKDEVFDATENILLNRATQAQIGAFLIGWRTKLETNEELSGAIEALRKYIKFPLRTPPCPSVSLWPPRKRPLSLHVPVCYYQ